MGLATQVPVRETFPDLWSCAQTAPAPSGGGVQAGQAMAVAYGQTSSGHGHSCLGLAWLGAEQAPSVLKILHSKLSSVESEARRAVRAAMPS
jgi:hypothetical protein